MVEHQPSKLRVAGSKPVSRSSSLGIRQKVNCRTKGCNAEVAQPVEHMHGKHVVVGSIPILGSYLIDAQLLFKGI